MKIIDLRVANAFRRMKAAHKTNAEVSRLVNLSQVHIARILSGKTKYLSNATWSRIELVMREYLRPEPAEEKSVLDSILDSVMKSNLDPEAKVKVYEIITEAKKQKEEQSQPEPRAVSYPTREDTLEITKGSAERPADVQKALVAYHEDDNIQNTTTQRGKISGNKMLNHQVRCTSCESLFYVPKVRMKKKIACPFCGQHIIIK